jgi:hypothetical protein
LVKARASLWCDSKRIYELQEVSVRLTEASNDIS